MDYANKGQGFFPSQDAKPSPLEASDTDPGIEQFILLSLEAWERLRTLDRLLDNERASSSYYNLLHKTGGHARRLTLKKFRETKLLFGPQAIVLLLPVIGFLQRLDNESPDDCESILAESGMQLPCYYSAELTRKGPNSSRPIQHMRRQTLRCIRNAAGHHMEDSLSLKKSLQGIEMPSDGSQVILRSDEYQLSFRKIQWKLGYLQMLDHICLASRRILKAPGRDQPC
jgi:hypothetical protein